jgi:hypothetical protein
MFSLKEFPFEEKVKHLRLLGESNIKFPEIGSESFEDFTKKLKNALENYLGQKYIYVVATYRNKVDVNVENSAGMSEYYEIPYEVKKGEFVFGSPVKVVKVTTFQKVESMRKQVLSFTENQKKRQQYLAEDGYVINQKGINEKKDGRVELRECLFDGGLTVLNKDLLLEGRTGIIKISGRAAKAGTVTGNQTFYPKEVLKKQVKTLQADVAAGKFLGQLDHPAPVGTHGRLSQTAIKYTKLGLDGDYLVFEGDVLPTPAGETLKSLLKSNVTVGISTRGFGATKKETINGNEV